MPSTFQNQQRWPKSSGRRPTVGIDAFINSVGDIKIFFQAHVLEKKLPGTLKCSVQNAMVQGATRQETLENTTPCPWHITR